jgi:hypothetical protein
VSHPREKPRVRRLLDVAPLPAAPSALKVRAFLECFDRGSGLSALMMAGRVTPDHFEISINGAAPISLPARTGTDEHGAFAWLSAQERRVGEHHAVRVDDDAHDADTAFAAISYFELPRDLLARSEVAFASRWYSVYFNALGLVDGCGSGGPRSLLPARLPS